MSYTYQPESETKTTPIGDDYEWRNKFIKVMDNAQKRSSSTRRKEGLWYTTDLVKKVSKLANEFDAMKKTVDSATSYYEYGMITEDELVEILAPISNAVNK